MSLPWFQPVLLWYIIGIALLTIGLLVLSLDFIIVSASLMRALRKLYISYH